MTSRTHLRRVRVSCGACGESQAGEKEPGEIGNVDSSIDALPLSLSRTTDNPTEADRTFASRDLRTAGKAHQQSTTKTPQQPANNSRKLGRRCEISPAHTLHSQSQWHLHTVSVGGPANRSIYRTLILVTVQDCTQTKVGLNHRSALRLFRLMLPLPI